MGFCNFSIFCCALPYVHSSIAIILMGKRELVALLSLSSWHLVIVVWLFVAVSWVCLQFVIMVFPDYILTYYFFSRKMSSRCPQHEECVDANVELSLGWTFDFVLHCTIITLMIYTQYIAANRTDKVHKSHSKKLGV